jgi:hypothetical protein
MPVQKRNKRSVTFVLSPADEKRLQLAAEKMGLIWGGRGSISQLMERLAVLFGAYPDRFPRFPVPNRIADYLVRRSQQGDAEAKELLESLDSWSTVLAWDEAIATATKVTKIDRDDCIV